MEYVLWEKSRKGTGASFFVLILVVMEYVLWDDFYVTPHGRDTEVAERS